MARLLLFIAVAVTALSSCSVYRSGETTKTPDDVYYSPAKPGAAYVEVEKKQDNGYYRGADAYNTYDDRWLRMRVSNRYRWSSFDDYDWNDWRYSSFANSAFSYSPYYFNNYWNNYYTWNSYYNPYCSKIIVLNPSVNQPVYSKVRNFSLGAYTNTNYNSSNRPLGKTSTRYISPSSYNNSNNSTRTNNSLGSSIRKVFSNGNSNSGNSYYTPSSSDRPVRSYTPATNSSTQSSTPTRSTSSSSGSSSSGSSSSGSSGGGAGSRPARGN
jgi:hypothetical protein